MDYKYLITDFAEKTGGIKNNEITEWYKNHVTITPIDGFSIVVFNDRRFNQSVIYGRDTVGAWRFLYANFDIHKNQA